MAYKGTLKPGELAKLYPNHPFVGTSIIIGMKRPGGQAEPTSCNFVNKPEEISQNESTTQIDPEGSTREPTPDQLSMFAAVDAAMLQLNAERTAKDEKDRPA